MVGGQRLVAGPVRRRRRATRSRRPRRAARGRPRPPTAPAAPRSSPPWGATLLPLRDCPRSAADGSMIRALRRPRRRRPGRGAAARRPGRCGGVRPRRRADGAGRARLQHDLRARHGRRRAVGAAGAHQLGQHAGNVRAQLAWQRALADESDVEVPRPRQTGDGEWFAEVACPGFGGPVLVTVSGWLDGPDVGEPDAEVAAALGRAMARLHEHAAGWRVPDGASLARFDTPLFGDPDLLADLPGLAAGDRTVLDRARSSATTTFGRLLRSGQRLHVLARRPARRQPEVAPGDARGLRLRRLRPRAARPRPRDHHLLPARRHGGG